MSIGGAVIRSLAVLGVVALLGGCVDSGDGDDGDDPAADEPTSTSAGDTTSTSADGSDGPPVEGVSVEISALDNSFRPKALEVAAGTEVVWTNDGRNDHNVLPVEGEAWGVEVEDFAPGGTYRHRFTEPGTYDYYCSLHGTTTKGMVGTVVVTG
jgi:plastocyanin